MISKIFIAAQGSFPASMLLLGRRPARMRPAPLARTSVLPRQNLGAGGIHFRRAFQSFQRNPWGACAPRNRPHHNRSHDIKDIHSCSRFLSYFYAVVGPSSGAYAPRAFGAYERFAKGKTSAQAEFISAEHPNHFGGIRGALAPHGTGPTIIGPMISKMFIVAQGSFPTSMLLLGRRRAGRILSKMFIL